jgi:hypothetical protein
VPNEEEPITEELSGDTVREKRLEFAERGRDSIPESEREDWAEPEDVSGWDDPCPFDAKQSFDDGPTPAPSAPDGTPIPSGTCP